MTVVWNKIEQLAKQIEDRFNTTGEPIDSTVGTDYNWHNQLWSSPRYRRAHIEIVDNR
jgi:hypothetical protein